MSLKISLKIIFYILFIYQLIDLVIDYIHYNYSIKVDLNGSPKILPSITICLNRTNDIVCRYKTDKGEYFYCQEDMAYLRIRNKDVCRTYFNDKNSLYHKILKKSILLILRLHIESVVTQFRVLIHPPNIASHFQTNNIFVNKGSEPFVFNIRKVTTFSLPKPYSTDCYDYDQSETSPRSQSYCMLEYMKREEMNRCGKNIYWNQYVVQNNSEFIYKNYESNECIVKFNYKLLSRLCEIDCISDKYTVKYHTYGTLNDSAIAIPMKEQFNINILYLTKLTMEQLCSNCGGLISMYFGLSMINIATIIYSKLLNIRWIKVIRLIILIIFKYLLKIICIILMLYQLLMILRSYSEANIQIKIDFTNEIKFNKIILDFFPIIDGKRQDEYFPNFNKKYNRKNLRKKFKIIHKHLYDLFNRDFELFVYITRLFDRRIECIMQFDDNSQLDCGEIKLSRIKTDNLMYLMYNIPGDNINNSRIINNLKLIIIKIHPIHYQRYLIWHSIWPDELLQIRFINSIFAERNDENFIYLQRYGINNLIVEPSYYRRLTHFGRQCNPRVRPLFDDSLTDDCIIDCIHKLFIDKFSCIPFPYDWGFIRLKRDIMEDKHKICNESSYKLIKYHTIMHKCINECEFDCELGLYKVTQFNNYNYHDDFNTPHHNYTTIIIHPKSNLIVHYEETYIMDGWELIYQLGGVIGMWVGWSAISITSILNKYYLICLCIKYFQLKLINILNYCRIKFINFYKLIKTIFMLLRIILSPFIKNN